VFGTVSSATRDELCIEPIAADRPCQSVRVVPGPGASIRRGDEIGLATFDVGDEVVALGQWASDARFRASTVESPLQSLWATVAAIDEQWLDTTAGPLFVPASVGAVPDDPFDLLTSRQLRVGDSIFALVRRNRRLDTRIAVRIGGHR
jgi:hypothetical protein